MFSDLRLRGTVSRDVRAATLLERFNQTGGVGTVTRDPVFPNDGTQIVLVSLRRQSDLDSGDIRHHARTASSTSRAGCRDSRPRSTTGTSTSPARSARSASSASSTTASPVRQPCAQLVTRDHHEQRLLQVSNITQNIAAAAGRGVDVEVGYRARSTCSATAARVSGARLFWSHLIENSTTTDRTNPAT